MNSNSNLLNFPIICFHDLKKICFITSPHNIVWYDNNNILYYILETVRPSIHCECVCACVETQIRFSTALSICNFTASKSAWRQKSIIEKQLGVLWREFVFLIGLLLPRAPKHCRTFYRLRLTRPVSRSITKCLNGKSVTTVFLTRRYKMYHADRLTNWCEQ